MKYFAFADCHGNFDALMDALREKGYDCHNPEHQLVGLGDYFGRATQQLLDNYHIWQYLTSPNHINPPVCLRGNHETILIDAIRRGHLTELDMRNGELATFCSFGTQMAAEDDDLLRFYPGWLAYDQVTQQQICSFMNKCGFEEWLNTLPWYYTTANYMFVHGFVPRDIGEVALSTYDDDTWHKCSWAKTPVEIAMFAAKHPSGIDKTIVFGHWRTSELNEKVFGGDWPITLPHCDPLRKLIGLDLTTVVSGEVGCLVFEDDAGDQKFDKNKKMCYNNNRKNKKEKEQCV